MSNKAILDHAGLCAKEFGFKRRGKSQSLSRSAEIGRHNIHVSFSSEAGVDYFSIDVSIRVDDVECGANNANPSLAVRESAATATIGCGLSALDSTVPYRWPVSTADEMIGSSMRAVAIPFFQKFTSRESIRSVLLKDSPDVWKYCPIHASRAIKAVEMTLLDHGLDDAIRVAEQKGRFLRGQGDPNIRIFQRYLDQKGLGDKVAESS